MEIENINIRETYYNQIYHMKPAWWMRWGISVVFVIITIILSLAYVIRYPDVIVSELRLTTDQPSITIPISKPSQFDKVFVKDGDTIHSKQPLALIDNNARYQDVLFLERKLNGLSLEKEGLLSFFEELLDKDLQLGSVIENPWIQFSSELLAYYKIEKLQSYDHQIGALQKELKRQLSLRKKYKQLIHTDRKEQLLINKRLQTDSTLFTKGVISQLQYNDGKQQYYSNSKQLQQNQLSLRRINIEVTRLQNAIANFGKEETSSVLTHKIGIRESLGKLRSAIATWKEVYLIESPMEGKVNFLQELSPGKFYEGNIIVVTPLDEAFDGILKIPFTGSGKVVADQKVLIKLNDYPYREYGTLEGTLSEISPVANESFYKAKVVINQKSISSYDKQILLKENMSGMGEIITEDRNVLSRVFEKVTYALRE